MQDFATEEEVQAWVQAQPNGMGRLKLGLLVGEGRLPERGLAVARRWLARSEASPQRIEPRLEPEPLATRAAPVPPPVQPAAPTTEAAGLPPPPPLFPARPPVRAVPADVQAAAASDAPASPPSAVPAAAAPASRPARRRPFWRWVEAVTILALLGVAWYLAKELARVAGRT